MLLPKALPAWWVDTERCKPCCNDGGLHIEVKHPLSALIKASAQGITVSPRNANLGDVLATLDAQHYLLAPMYQQTLGVPNVALWPKMCHCGNLHLKVTALRPIPAGTPLIVELKPVKDTHLVAQFDGSCHVQEGIGGAGGLVWSPGPVPVILETIAIPLQPCPDSMFAEICAADATLDKALSLAASNQIREVILQGDCINIVKHFAGALRLHREDLVRKLDNMWQKLTHTPITVHWSYVPRVGNKVADHLAGIAANSLASKHPFMKMSLTRVRVSLMCKQTLNAFRLFCCLPSNGTCKLHRTCIPELKLFLLRPPHFGIRNSFAVLALQSDQAPPRA